MALMTCRECSKNVSELARACPHCGSPTATARGSFDNAGRELLKLLLAAFVLVVFIAIVS